MDSKSQSVLLSLSHIILTALEIYSSEICCKDNASSCYLWEQTNTHCLFIFTLKAQDAYDSSSTTTITCSRLGSGKLGFSVFLSIRKSGPFPLVPM